MTDGAQTDGVLITRAGDVLRIMLTRPDRRNAITPEMLSAMISALEHATCDDELRAIALTAEGDHFCAGMDLAASNRASRDGSVSSPPHGRVAGQEPAGGDRRPRLTARHRAIDGGPHRLIELILSVEVPVVALVRGTAAGLGCALALAADAAVVSDTARFTVPYVRRGFTPDSGTTYLLARLAGLARAREMLLLGGSVDAAQAEAWGLVTRVSPDADADVRHAELVDELRAGPTVAIGLTKWLLNQGAIEGLQAAMRRESLVVDLSIRTMDFKEGVAAFLDKRPPSFEGR